MAAPVEMTTLDLSGQFTMNYYLSDANRDDILYYQGVSWIKRKAIQIGTVTLAVKHTKDNEDGFEHIDITQTVTGGIPGTSENRILSWKERENEDHVFGSVKGKSRRVNPNEIDNEWLKNGWLPDTYEHGAIHSYIESDQDKSGVDWIAEQIWGFEEIEVEPGKRERRYVRHVQFIGPSPEKKNIACKLVYDYIGPNIEVEPETSA